MVTTHYVTIFLLLVYFFLGVGGICAVAIYALIAVAYSSFTIWFMKFYEPSEPKPGFMTHYSFAIGTAIGLFLYGLLLVMCNFPSLRRLRIRCRNWRGYDRKYEAIES